MSSLKQFIRNVRASKTIADERAVVQKESAAIRASFREETHNSDLRRNNVAKLLYLFTLGERTHFGQIECLKLLASPRFADKRLGYLGTMLLLDENQEVLTLVTNSLKNDLNHNNQYVVGLALCTLGNIASIEMARDLFPEVETIVASSNPYIRRKAALCAMRICRKVPDLQEHFFDKAKALLNDRNHGVLLSGLTLVISMCEADEEEGGEQGVVDMFKPLTGSLVKVLKGLSQSGYAPEHDVTGISDPFVQVKILHLLRVLGRGDTQISEQINDILAQVATNTDSSKNVGNAILYEAVLTILDIEADSGLRVLGVNILGKFLTNKDNNIRYVALNTLIKVVAIEPNAVQRHRNTILDCLRDPDISIRRRALDLSFTLINDQNVRTLVRELLAFLEVADAEFKPIMTSQIGIAADRFAPNKRWHVDTMLRVLKLAGNFVKEQILSSFVRLIATTPDLQTYCAQKLYVALREDISQEGLNLAGAWVIGEYGDALIRGGSYEEEELAQPVHESEIVDLFSTILNSSYAGQSVTEYIITSAMKLTTRLQDPAQVERLRRILMNKQTDLDVEVQQRSVEYGNLFGYDQVRRGVLERMPAPEIREEQRVLGESNTGKNKRKSNAPAARKRPTQITEQDMLLDLMGGDAPTSDGMGVNGGQQGGNNADLLADILGGGNEMTSPTATSPISNGAPAKSNTASIMDLFDSGPSPQPPQQQQQQSRSASNDLFGTTSPPPQQQQQPQAQAHVAYNKNDLLITFALSRTPQAVSVQARFRNNSMFESFGQLNLQAAVPKTQKLQLQALDKGELGPGEEAGQGMRVGGVNGPPPPRLRLRLRISYAKGGGGVVTEQVDWSEPA
ncbi:clathrin associated protein complex large subunit [Saxophila tyrrhenica]|uniref:AP-1 complex subunit gamma n=1 Tax=Saxophila tyrrhenica TaxID=1690608 RepID=A0AAV9PJB4_9PEZI|nr:clathrin associated protein complex large subunit [Saxophila tyrrhenica]